MPSRGVLPALLNAQVAQNQTTTLICRNRRPVASSIRSGFAREAMQWLGALCRTPVEVLPSRGANGIAPFATTIFEVS